MATPFRIAFVGVDHPHGAGWRELLPHLGDDVSVTAIVPAFGGGVASLEERHAHVPRFATVGELVAHGRIRRRDGLSSERRHAGRGDCAGEFTQTRAHRKAGRRIGSGVRPRGRGDANGRRRVPVRLPVALRSGGRASARDDRRRPFRQADQHRDRPVHRATSHDEVPSTICSMPNKAAAVSSTGSAATGSTWFRF